ncbi:MAG: HAD family phosphatase [Prevotella sp.]|nr:HAD family phosphatase [Prevotella sp.]
MIKNIIFDLGGVIMTLSHPGGVKRFKELGVADAEKQLDPYTQTGIFGDLEGGRITAEECRLALSKMVGREVTFEECKYCWLGYRADLPPRNLDVLKKLRREGYRLILLSNTNPFMMDWAESGEFDGEGNSIHHYFDALYMSYRVKAMKPSEYFFRYVLEKEGIKPEETLFLDDGPRNVAMASDMGIHTFCPENGSDWTDEIYKYL